MTPRESKVLAKAEKLVKKTCRGWDIRNSRILPVVRGQQCPRNMWVGVLVSGKWGRGDDGPTGYLIRFCRVVDDACGMIGQQIDCPSYKRGKELLSKLALDLGCEEAPPALRDDRATQVNDDFRRLMGLADSTYQRAAPNMQYQQKFDRMNYVNGDPVLRVVYMFASGVSFAVRVSLDCGLMVITFSGFLRDEGDAQAFRSVAPTRVGYYLRNRDYVTYEGADRARLVAAAGAGTGFRQVRPDGTYVDEDPAPPAPPVEELVAVPHVRQRSVVLDAVAETVAPVVRIRWLTADEKPIVDQILAAYHFGDHHFWIETVEGMSGIVLSTRDGDKLAIYTTEPTREEVRKDLEGAGWNFD